MRRHLAHSVFTVFLLVVTGPVGLTAKAAAQEVPADQPTTRTAFDPQKLLAGLDLTKEQQETRRELEGVLDAAREPLDTAAAHLALANWLLAVPTARAATRWFLGLDRPEDRKAMAESAAAARDHLSKAGPLLKTGDTTAGSSEKARRKRLSAGSETLKAFAEVFAAVGVKDDADSLREKWSEAAVDLSEARESDNAAVASAATLWQAMAWETAGRRERALVALPDALAKPDQPFDFMSRMVRCRILSEAGQYTAAMALTTQIRSRIEEWFPRERTVRQHARQRLVGLVQWRISQAWMKALRAGTHPADAELLAGILGDVQQALFPPEDTSPEVYMLDEAIPILIKPPAVKPLASTPAHTPATQPD